MDNQIDNPFDLTKASDFSDRQVIDFWVDMAAGQSSLVSFIKPKSKTPMFLLGGKGSGKTHLMRYCSSTVQNLRFQNLREAVTSEGYLGAYTNADGLNVHRFKGKGQSDDIWETVFAYSFELWLASTFLEALEPALADIELRSLEWQRIFISLVRPLFNSEIDSSVVDFKTLLVYLNLCRKKVDSEVNHSAFTRSLTGIQINFNPGALVFGLPKIISSTCSFAEDTLFLYLIDEVENFTPEQQRFLNTLIRYRRENVSFRIGARLYGIKTYETLGSGEPIKQDAEFEPVYLDAMLRENQSQYESLAVSLILKRLEASKSYRFIGADRLAEKFNEVSSADYFRKASLEVTAGRDSAGKDRPHLQRLRRALDKAIGDEEISRSVVAQLSFLDNPLLEKVNVLIFYKRLSKKVDLFKLAEEINEEMLRLIEKGPSGAPDYYNTYSHFSSDLFAQLCRDYGKKPIYAGLRTLIRISQGVPRNLLSLLKHIHRRSVFLGESPFDENPISVEAQASGINDASAWFWEDAQPDSHGTLVRGVVENIATLIRTIRYSENPSECDLCSFKVITSDLSADAIKVLKMAENWSYILKVNTNSSSKNDDRTSTQYQINPMLASRWGISESRRGVIEMKSSMLEILTSLIDPEKVKKEISERVEEMNLPKILENKIFLTRNVRQSGLFDG